MQGSTRPLKIFIEKLGLSREEFCVECGIDPKRIPAIFDGNRINLQEIIAIENRYTIPLSSIVAFYNDEYIPFNYLPDATYDFSPLYEYMSRNAINIAMLSEKTGIKPGVIDDLLAGKFSEDSAKALNYTKAVKKAYGIKNEQVYFLLGKHERTRRRIQEMRARWLGSKASAVVQTRAAFGEDEVFDL